MATKATQTHFRGIRPSSQGIAIFAKRPIGCTDSVNRLEEQRACKLILAKEDVLTVSRALELALFIDAKLDVPKLRGRI
jgi:hypothetical protein